jgi:PAS domain S-box-containing protein
MLRPDPGLRFDQMCGEGWAKAIHPDDLGAMAQLWRFSVLNGVPYQFEFRGRRADAMYRWCIFNAVPLRDEEGRVVKWYGTIVDLHDWKQAQEALQKAQTELAHVTRVTTLGEMTASIAHEINQPLAAIATNASASLRWLARDSPDLTEAREAISRIIRDRNRASEVISRMRALFKKAPAATESVDINEVIQEVLTLSQTELQRNRVSLGTQFANDLPIVMGDKIQLQQVILNLVVNAIEAMSGVVEGPRELCVSSQKVTEIPGEAGKDAVQANALTEPESAFVLIAVRDSGLGLKKGFRRPA